jgi:hypothetical protein
LRGMHQRKLHVAGTVLFICSVPLFMNHSYFQEYFCQIGFVTSEYYCPCHLKKTLYILCSRWGEHPLGFGELPDQQARQMERILQLLQIPLTDFPPIIRLLHLYGGIFDNCSSENRKGNLPLNYSILFPLLALGYAM